MNEETKQLERKPAATAFFVIVEIPETDLSAMYVVTARHVIEASRPYESLFVRFNLVGGKYIDLASKPDDWAVHSNTDVAAIPTILPKDADVLFLPSKMFVTPEFINANGVTEGDDVFFSGLFQGYPGQERMQPIIRFGNISLMPYEKVPVKISPDNNTLFWVEAYLVESRSWGGHSGSPTFLYFLPDRKPGVIEIEDKIPIALLGLVSAHWEISQKVDFIGDILGSGTVDVNAGLAIVIPAQYISELLERDDFVEMRMKLAGL